MSFNNFRRSIGFKSTLAGTSLLLLSVISCSSVPGSPQSQSTENGSFELVQCPKIPDNVEFAGEKVPIHRLDVRERFDRELLSNTFFHSNTFLCIKRANRYFPVIEPILKEMGVPEDFKYLAVIESSLDQRALSPAGAAGIWQFIPETGKIFGLEVNTEIDERYNLEKSTRAACKYLKSMYTDFGSWTKAAASYNAGQRRITQSLEKQRAENFYDLLLNEETSRYIFRIIALKTIMSQPKSFGFSLQKDDLYPYVEVEKFEINGAVADFSLLAKKYGVNYRLLKEFNPWLRDQGLLNKQHKTYQISIPLVRDLDNAQIETKVHDKNWVE